MLKNFDPTRQIAIIWDIDDVKQERPQLTDAQAMEVLQRVYDSHDADIGVTWSTLRDYADELLAEGGSNV